VVVSWYGPIVIGIDAILNESGKVKVCRRATGLDVNIITNMDAIF